MNKELQKIANTLVLYNSHIRNDGLLNGRMGMILFLYRYAEYAGCKYYREFADELLDNVLGSVANMPIDFEDGLSGIGWAVNYLIKKGLVDGDTNDVLQDVDKRIFSRYSCNPLTSIFGQGIYLIERLKENPSNADFEKRVVKCLDFCSERIKDYKGAVSLYHINSILFFLFNIENNLPDNEVMNHIKKYLPESIRSMFKDKLFEDADLYILKRMLDRIAPEQRSGWDSVLSLQMPARSDNLEIETIIRISWQEMVYFGHSTLEDISLDDISHFIVSKQKSLTINDFLLAKGLAGLGNRVLG